MKYFSTSQDLTNFFFSFDTYVIINLQQMKRFSQQMLNNEYLTTIHN